MCCILVPAVYRITKKWTNLTHMKPAVKVYLLNCSSCGAYVGIFILIQTKIILGYLKELYVTTLFGAIEFSFYMLTNGCNRSSVLNAFEQDN